MAFFNKSKYKLIPSVDDNEKVVSTQTFTKEYLIYDSITLEVPTVITGELYNVTGRNVEARTLLADGVTITQLPTVPNYTISATPTYTDKLLLVVTITNEEGAQFTVEEFLDV